jgi:hypothetical protein
MSNLFEKILGGVCGLATIGLILTIVIIGCTGDFSQLHKAENCTIVDREISG